MSIKLHETKIPQQVGELIMNGIIAALRSLIGIVVIAIVCAPSARAADSDTLILLLPDETSLVDNRVAAWSDAAREEGLQLKVLYDSEFLSLGTGALKYRGLILPDEVHVKASDALIDAVTNYVNAGGQIMLVYDFGALTPTGFYVIPKSRLSHLAGVDYVLYEELRDRTVGLGPVTGMESWMWKLGVPPGKSMPYDSSATTTGAATTGASAGAADQVLYLPSDANDPGGTQGYDHSRFFRYGKRNTKGDKLVSGTNDDIRRGGKAQRGRNASADRYWPSASTSTDALHGISGYVYGFLTYPSFVTRGAAVGDVILTSPDFGMVAGVNPMGQGKVLFVNLPLSTLKGQTDGMLMHGFLRYFAAEMLRFPVMASHPNAKGGLVLNWHVDDGSAIDAIAFLDQYKIWNDGPYSIHFTAGPDVVTFGDGLGMNLPNNSVAQDWMKKLLQGGHQIGNHGGWIHDYFGLNANETNGDEFLKYLVWNRDAVFNVTRQHATEFSATEGNNPSWALNWLESEGILAYYFGGHTGMAFTRNYQNGRLTNPGMWAVPVTPYGKVATFEEFEELHTPAQEILNWYQKLVDYSVANRTSRLVYMHPPGATAYPEVVTGLLDRARSYSSSGRFKWYTMTDLARFAQRHLDTRWSTTESSSGMVTFQATHDKDLTEMTWLLPTAAYARPAVTQGDASVTEDSENWKVRVNNGKSVQFSAQHY